MVEIINYQTAFSYLQKLVHVLIFLASQLVDGSFDCSGVNSDQMKAKDYKH